MPPGQNEWVVGRAALCSYASLAFCLPSVAWAAPCVLRVPCCFNHLLPQLGLGGAALSAHVAVPHCFCTFSGWDGPACGYRSISLVLHSLWVGCPVCTFSPPVACSSSSTLLHRWIGLQVEGPYSCMLWRFHVPAGPSSRRGGWGILQRPCSSAGEPGYSSRPRFKCRGNGNSGAHSPSGPG